MSISEPGIDFRGRFEFLAAMQELWPEVLASLPKFERTSGQAWPATFSELQSMPEHHQCAGAISKWARTHSVEDQWILDAATQTVGAKLGKWYYVPLSLPTPKFEPGFGVWLPSSTTPWSWYRETTTKSFKQQLDDYRKIVQDTWGVNKRRLEVHARWTVMWQRGKSPEQIRNAHKRTTGGDVTTANIQTSVTRFAQSIGLSLRASKSNRARSI